MKYRISGPLSEYTDLELALLVMSGQFGNGQNRRNALGARYDAIQSLVEYLAVGIVPEVKNRGSMSPADIRAALEKIRPTNADFDAMVNDFISALNK